MTALSTFLRPAVALEMPQGVCELLLELEGAVTISGFASDHRPKVSDLSEKGSTPCPVILAAALTAEQRLLAAAAVTIRAKFIARRIHAHR